MSSKKIILKSSNGETFELDEEVAMLSQTIKNMIEDDCTDNGIPLPNVTSQTLVKVIEYCKKHAEKPKDDDNEDYKLSELKAWDAEFIQVDQKTLFDLTMAANYMNIESLMELSVHTWADMMRGKNVEDIRKTFNIKNDLTPEEEEAYRKDNQWAFEPLL